MAEPSSLDIHLTTQSKHENHQRFYSTKTFRLLCMLSLTFTYFIVELVVGNITNSLALLADAFHMLSDLIALVIALLAVRISKRRSDINTYGWVRAEIVGANINTVFLLALCLTILFDVIKRYIQPEPITNVNLLLIVGSIGLGINIIGLFLFQGFHGHSHGGGKDAHNHQMHSTSESKTTNETDSDKRDKESVVVIHHENPQGNQKTTAENEDEDIKSIENMPGPSEFKRHSTRALEEVIVDCATHSHSHSHGTLHVRASSLVSTSSTAPSAGKKLEKKTKSASMNMHGIFLHVLADALGSAVVIISALVIKLVPHDPNNHKHWTIYVDPTLSLIIIIIITISAIPLFKETSFILLQTMPKHIKVNDLKKQLLEEVPEVDGIHELHIWRLTGEKFIASAHVRRRSLADYMPIADKVKRFFHSMGIHSTTIQYEYGNDDRQTLSINNNNDDHPAPELTEECLLRCTNIACDTLTCCAKTPIRSDTAISLNNNGNGIQRSTIVPAETRIELKDEHNQENDCDHEHHFHTHVSMKKLSQNEKY